MANFNLLTGNLVRTSARIFLLTGTFFALQIGCSKKNPESAQAGGARRGGPVTVEAQVVQPRFLQNRISATGTILANEKVELKPEVSGRVVSINFTEGSLVEKGKLLMKINDADLQAQLSRNQAQEKLLADEEYRKRKLLEIKAISQEEYDAAYNQLKITQADKQLLLAQIAKTEVYAPFSGKIGLRSVSPGNFVVSNTVVATLQQLNPVKIEFDVPEKYSGLIREGQEISFQIENSDSLFTGRIFASEAGITAETRSLKVRALCPNNGQKLIPGTFARISIVLESFPDALTIPSEALISDLTKSSVYLCKEGRASLVEVQTGLRTETEIQILSGIQPGDSLIVSGLLQISNGSPVVVKETGRTAQAQTPN